MLIRMVLAFLVAWALVCPAFAVAGTYQVQIANTSPYCLSLVAVAVPGTDPAKGIFLHFPGQQKTKLLSGKTVVGRYELPRPAKTVEVQAGPCTPTTHVPRRVASADQPGRERNVFTIAGGPNQTIVIK